MKEIDIQERYEELLTSHWQKLHQIKELVDSDRGSALRAISIIDRRAELAMIVGRKNALEHVFDDCNLVKPEWYNNLYSRLKKYEDPFYRY